VLVLTLCRCTIRGLPACTAASIGHVHGHVRTVALAHLCTARQVNPDTPRSQDPESIRYQVVRMMRLLVEITQTLDQMPGERYIHMKMEYTDDCPPDFTTPGFEDLDADKLTAHFPHAPFSMCAPGSCSLWGHACCAAVCSMRQTVWPITGALSLHWTLQRMHIGIHCDVNVLCRPAGTVETGHHEVGLQVRTILDMDDDSMEEGAGITPTPASSHAHLEHAGLEPSLSIPNLAGLELDSAQGTPQVTPEQQQGGKQRVLNAAAGGKAYADKEPVKEQIASGVQLMSMCCRAKPRQTLHALGLLVATCAIAEQAVCKAQRVTMLLHCADEPVQELIWKAVQGQKSFTRQELPLYDCLCDVSVRDIDTALKQLVKDKVLVKKVDGSYAVKKAVAKKEPEATALKSPEPTGALLPLEMMREMTPIMCLQAIIMLLSLSDRLLVCTIPSEFCSRCDTKPQCRFKGAHECPPQQVGSSATNTTGGARGRQDSGCHRRGACCWLHTDAQAGRSRAQSNHAEQCQAHKGGRPRGSHVHLSVHASCMHRPVGQIAPACGGKNCRGLGIDVCSGHAACASAGTCMDAKQVQLRVGCRMCTEAAWLQ
jgi:HORMA domain